MNLPALVFPFYDPQALYFPHIEAALPDLKAHFSRAYISLPQTSAQKWPENSRKLLADDFFSCYQTETEGPIGSHFGNLYRWAAATAPAEQVLHLCFPDRLVFALRTGHRDAFLAETAGLGPQELPLIYHRSPSAWATHPANYARIEGFVTRLGETLFGKTLDYGWCHMVIQAAELRQVMTKIDTTDLSMVAELVLHIQHHAQTREVDWLAWEDPFLLGRDPAAFKAERERHPDEYEKRLSYCLPMAEKLARFAASQNKKE